MELDETDHEGAAVSIAGQGSSDTAAPSADQKVVEIEVHGLKARIFLNCPEEDLIPSRYLKKAQRSRMYMFITRPWLLLSTYLPQLVHRHEIVNPKKKEGGRERERESWDRGQY